MQFGVLITNGGAHPPEKWAVATAQQIFPIDQKIDSDRMVMAKRAELAIVEALLPHHAGIQTTERSGLAASVDHLDTPLDADAEADQAVAAVCAALKGTPWENKTADPAWRAEVRSIIHQHFRTAKDIERQWHVKRQGA